MTENLQISDIQSKIYSIRGFKVMLDSDLSDMYGVPTKVLNQPFVGRVTIRYYQRANIVK